MDSAELQEILKKSQYQRFHSEPISFMFSPRGQYIMAQALYYGIKALESVEPEMLQEKSNLKDMHYIKDMLFPFPDIAFATPDEAVVERLKELEEKKADEGKTQV